MPFTCGGALDMRSASRHSSDIWSSVRLALCAKQFQQVFSVIEQYLNVQRFSKKTPDEETNPGTGKRNHWFPLMALSRELLQCRGLQIYCLLKLGRFEEAAEALDEFQNLLITRGEALSNASCHVLPTVAKPTDTKETFFLHLLTALLPLLYMQKNQQKETPQTPSLANHSTEKKLSEMAYYARKFYQLLSWTRHQLFLAAQEIESSRFDAEEAGMHCVTSSDASDGRTREFDTYALWASRHWMALHCFTNCLLQSDAFESAITFINNEMQDGSQRFLAKTPQGYYPHYLLGRARLAAGDFDGALRELKLVTTLVRAADTSNQYQTFLETVMAIIYLCTERMSTAVSLFQAHQAPISIHDQMPPSSSSLRPQSPARLAVTLNNLAVASLYKGSVRDAIAHLERFVFSPISTDCLELPFFAAFRNLLTLYEFTAHVPVKIAGLRNRVLRDTRSDDVELLNLFAMDETS